MTEHSMVSTLPNGPFRFIALDVETASRDNASICQIGIACVQSDNHIQTFTTYVNPEQSFASFNTELHGIDAETVADAPSFPEAWALLKPLLQLHHLVQHSSFDSRALTAACRAYRMPNADLSWSDSVKIARKAWPEFKGNGGHGLANLKQELGLSFHHHDAGEDARAAAQVVLMAETRLGQSFDLISGTTRKSQFSLPLDRT
ncbi:3'-5' exonuclease [Pseudophaeobacter sp.]|uniref:3'-5' exonuclease n=1 Tax=Pseudophaeobacter sp. TaxID=1971739 RepID=UPI00329A221C